MLSAEERRQLVVGWNEDRLDVPHACLHQLFETWAEKTPEAIAGEFNGEKMTYRELNLRANRLANYLQEQGVGPESLVGICFDRSLEMLVGIYGVLKAGAGYAADPNAIRVSG